MKKEKKEEIFVFIFILYIVCVCVRECAHYMVNMWKSEDNL